MVVQHNIQSINANRQLGIVTGAQAKSTEKLSSGYKINRAADDAAGLSISEKMRRQIRGLDRASTNAQDGVSAVQTAEGALNEVHDMLQRMNELANQAANGTNSMTDRQAIQDEISQLNTEIDRVSETTKFNETYLLKGAPGTKEVTMKGHDAGIKGTLSDTGETATFTATLDTDMDIQISGKNYHIYDANDTIESFQSKVDAAENVTINGTTYTRKSTVTEAVEAADPASVAAKRASAANLSASAATLITSGATLDTSAATLSTSAATLKGSAAALKASAAALQTSAAALEASASTLETSAATLTASAASKTTSAANKLASSQLKSASAELKGASSTSKQSSADVKTASASSKTLGASALRVAAAGLSGTEQADKLASAALMEASAATLAASAATLGGSAAALLASAATLRGSANALKASSRTLEGSAATKTASAAAKTASAEGKRASSNAKNASATTKDASSITKTASATTKNSSADTKTASADVKRESAATKTQSANTLAASADTMATGKEASESDIKFITPDREYLASELKAMIVDGAQVGINGAQSRTAVDTVNNLDNITMQDARDKIVYALTQANQVGVDDTTAVKVSDDGEGQVAKNYEFTITKGSTTVAKDLNFDLHVGADADLNNKIGVNIATMNSKYLGVQNLQVADDSGMMATYAIDAVEDAIQKVNEQRSALGAVQNRLEHTINNLDNVVENTTAAESRIRDTDIADEMVQYSKNNILSQAGQSMLAQANQSTQGALSLLG